MRTFVVAVLAFLVVAAPASAEPEIALDAGVGGIVAPGEPFDLTATVSSDVLWVGDLVIDTGSLAIVTAVEVPAGTTKEVTVRVPAVSPDTTVRVILRVDGEIVTQERLTVADAGDGAPVAVFGSDPGLVTTVASAQMAPTGTNPTVVTVEAADLGDLGAFPYLVVGRSFPAESAQAIEDWVVAGGRLVGTDDLVGDLARGPAADLDGAGAYSVGAGEVVVVDPAADSSVWDRVLRDPGRRLDVSSGGEWSSPYSALQTAAVGVGGSPLAPLPFVLPILGLYVLAVGPINLIVLGRLGKRQWAWVTIPGLSVVAIAALWALGPSNQSVTVFAATVEVVDGADSVRHSGFSLLSSGNTSVTVETGAPTAGVGPRRQAVMSSGDGAVTSELRTGEPTGLHTVGGASTAVVEVLQTDGWTVTNDGTDSFDVWGIVDGKTIRYDTELAPGATAQPSRSTQVFEDPWEPYLMNVFWEIGNLDARGGDAVWQVYRPLVAAAGSFADVRAGTWFFGLRAEDQEPITIDGRSRSAPAVTLVLQRVDEEDTSTRPIRVVAVEGLTQERFAGSGGFFYGVGTLDTGHNVVPGTTEILIREVSQFGPRPTLSLWDPTAGEWVDADLGVVPDGARFVGPSGDVYLRLDTGAGGEIYPRSYVVEAAP